LHLKLKYLLFQVKLLDLGFVNGKLLVRDEMRVPAFEFCDSGTFATRHKLILAFQRRIVLHRLLFASQLFRLDALYGVVDVIWQGLFDQREL